MAPARIGAPGKTGVQATTAARSRRRPSTASGARHRTALRPGPPQAPAGSALARDGVGPGSEAAGVGSDPATTHAQKRGKRRTFAVAPLAFEACSARGSSAQTACRRRPLPRNGQGDGMGAPLPERQRATILSSASGRSGESAPMAVPLLLPDGDTFPPDGRNAGGEPPPRHAASQRPVRAVVQSGARAGRAPVRRSLLLSPCRAGIARGRTRAVHRSQPRSGRPLSVA